MVDSIYKKLLEKHTLEELKDGIPAENSLEQKVSSAPAFASSREDLPESDGSRAEPIVGKRFLEVLTDIKEIFITIITSMVAYPLYLIILPVPVIAYVGKSDPRYEFNGYIGKEKVHFYETVLQNTDRIEVEKENGTKLIYLSPWRNDNAVEKVISVKPDGEEVTLCDDDLCLGEATRIANDYKIKILNEKERIQKENEKKFREQVK